MAHAKQYMGPIHDRVLSGYSRLPDPYHSHNLQKVPTTDFQSSPALGQLWWTMNDRNMFNVKCIVLLIICDEFIAYFAISFLWHYSIILHQSQSKTLDIKLIELNGKIVNMKWYMISMEDVVA